jgi:hypothetical protein
VLAPADMTVAASGYWQERATDRRAPRFICVVSEPADTLPHLPHTVAGPRAISARRQFPGEHDMIRNWLAATTALAMMTGVAVAQTSSSTTTSTQMTAPIPAPVYGGSSSSSSQQTTDSNGVQTDKTQTYTNGTTMTPSGTMSTTRKTTDTTTTQ